MLAIHSSKVRKNWSQVMDSATRKRPVFIQRTNDYMMLMSVPTVAQLVSDVKIVVNRFNEADGSITLSIEGMDIVANGETLGEAKKLLLENLSEYANDYYQDFELYSHAPNRKDHLPCVTKVITAKSMKELEDALVWRRGKN